MSSALACVGLAVSDGSEFERLLKSVYPDVRGLASSTASMSDAVEEAKQYDQLAALSQQVSGSARITALGIDVTVYPDPTAYAASSDSQVPGAAPEPPPDYAGPWPPRLAAESFISHAAFADSPERQSRARLSGTDLNATPHVCALTGQPFTVAAVRTAGFTADLCLDAGDHPEVPSPGSVISGTVVLSAAIDSPLLKAARA